MGQREVELEISSILVDLETMLSREGIVEGRFLTYHDRGGAPAGYAGVEFNQYAAKAFQRIKSLVLWTNAEKFEEDITPSKHERSIKILQEISEEFGIDKPFSKAEEKVSHLVEVGLTDLLSGFAKAIEMSGYTREELCEQAESGEFETIDAMVGWTAMYNIEKLIAEGVNS